MQALTRRLPGTKGLPCTLAGIALMVLVASAAATAVRYGLVERGFRIHHVGSAPIKASAGSYCFVRNDHDLASSVPFFHVADRGRGLAQRITPIDDGRHLAGLHEPGQESQVLLFQVREKPEELLAHEWRQHERLDQTIHGPDPVTLRSSNDDHGASGSQNPPQRKQRVIADIVQDQVITLAALGEIFLRVVNDVIRPDGADQVQVSRAAYAGDLRAE